jgi:hypothetical protein
MTAKRKKLKRPPMPGAGAPLRAADGPSTTTSLRLSPGERACLQALAAQLGKSESDVLRLGLAELAKQRSVVA